MRLSDQVEELGRQLYAAGAGRRPPEDLIEYMELQRSFATTPRGFETDGDVFWVMNRADWTAAVHFVEHGRMMGSTVAAELLGIPVLIADESAEPPYLARRVTPPAGGPEGSVEARDDSGS